jgi:hypothetical protein
MFGKILIYGVIAGLVAGGALSFVALNVHQSSAAWGMAIGYLIMLVALSAIFVAVKRQRDIDGGGVIRFWPAFGLGIAISIVASVVYALCWDTALQMGTIHFGHSYAAAEIAKAKADGMAPARLAQKIAEMNAFAENYDGNILYRLPMTMIEILPVGLLVSLLSAVMLWKGWFRPARDTSPEVMA